ncbi:MAG: hypothetical protein K1Y02_26575 [Candidatus Hydrogenedentes bacterium]|nr:hypothetical protein [Candidatus Hydrogenedentota bacterium]
MGRLGCPQGGWGRCGDGAGQIHYRAKPEDTPVVTWLTYVFQLQDGQWRIVHDQNTALDFVAFARMAGIEIK